MRRQSPAAARNKGPIAAVLRDELPGTGRILEIASGTGEHVAHFAELFAGLQFLPSDPSPEARDSVAAWRQELREQQRVTNIMPPIDLDVTRAPWPVEEVAGVLCINMIHISPWQATEALFAQSARILPAGAPLITYGPYRRQGRHTSLSNEAFDADLRARDPEWGVRDLEAVTREAQQAGFDATRVVEMPANNLILIFRRRG